MSESNEVILFLNEDNFEQLVLHSQHPVIAMFKADWCGTCHMMAPTIESIAAKYYVRVRVGYLDADVNTRIVKRYGIRVLPTILFFNNGEIVDHVVGAVSRKIMEEKLLMILGKTKQT